MQDLLFENHPDPCCLADPNSLAVLALNAAARRLFPGAMPATLTTMFAPTHPPPAVTWALGDTPIRVPLRTPDGTAVDHDLYIRAARHEDRDVWFVLFRPVAMTPPVADASRLVEQEANLRTAQRLLGLGIWTINVATRELAWSPEVFTIYGVPFRPGPVDLDDYTALVHPNDREEMLARFGAFLEERPRVYSFQHRIVRPNGEVALVRGIGELTVQGAEQVLTGVVQDITDQTRDRQRLLEADTLVRLAGRIARLGGFRYEILTGRVQWSEETALINDMPSVRDIDVFDTIALCGPEYVEMMSETFQRCIQEGTPYDVEYVMITSTGARKWVRSIGEAERDEAGTVIAVRGALQDIDDIKQARERSEMLDNRLRSTLENMGEAFFTIRPDWTITYVNPQTEAYFGEPRDALIGTRLLDHFPEVRGSDFEAQCLQCLQDRQSAYATEYVKPLGRWFASSIHPADDGLAIYFRDVTSERANQERLSLLESAVSRQSDMLMITENFPQAGTAGRRIIYVNDAFIGRMKYARDKVIGAVPEDFFGPRTSPEAIGKIIEGIRDQKAVRTELIAYASDGEEVWIEIDSAPIIDDRGRCEHRVSVLRDITERRRAEETVRVSSERFRLVAKATNDVVWDWDIAADTMWWNEIIRERFGYDPTELAEGLVDWASRVHQDDRQRVEGSIRAAVEGTGSNWEESYRFLRADDSIAHVVDRGFIIRDPQGKAVRMLGSMVDMTEQRELDSRLRQSQRLETVGHLTGGVAHDFNNLLTVILGNAEEMRSRLPPTDPLFSLADITTQAAARGAELTSRLLSFARRQPLEPRPLDLNKALSTLDGLLRRTLSEDIALEIVQGAGLWIADVDPGQLEVAILNLVVNARDAMESGGKLTIETGNAFLEGETGPHPDEIQPGPYVVLSVSDTGTGMPPEVIARAFEPFFTTKEVGRGSGLGLSMVYGFVKQSGGHARIYSEPGSGTTVRLYFPRSATNVSAPQSTTRIARPIGGTERILVVEDDDLVREYVTNALIGLGYDIKAAANAREALDLLASGGRFDLLFTDIVMPGGMNGRELADEARARDPALKVLFTSGYTENAVVHHGRLDPGVQLLSKPYRREQLAAKVRTLLDGA